MEEKHQQLGESFFNKPFEYFIIELDKLQVTNRIQYAVLVLCLINDSKLSIECLPHELMQEVFNNCGVDRGASDEKIKDAIYHMSETYFTKLDTEYTFTHDFIFEAIAYHYGRQNQNGRQSKNQQQQQILKYLSSSYIANKVTVYKPASNEDLCIHISEDMYLPLAERLYTDIQSMNLFDVFMNKSLEHGPFLDVFKGMLRTKPFDEFESLILRKRRNIQHFVNTNFSAEKQMFDFISYERLSLLFDEVCDMESDSEYNVRVISWIINYGHTHLLQEIVNHVEFKHHNTSLVFGSNVRENTRLLLLGCYSNTLEMVKLIREYVDPKCIDMDFTYASLSTRNVTPLIVGCMTGKLCIVKVLLKYHADINKCNNQNVSPLLAASGHGHIDGVKHLLSAGADISLSDKKGQSPLLAASGHGHIDIVKHLLSAGADINLSDKREQSPLFIASYYEHCDVVKCLLSSGADMNLCDKEGQSPLFIASEGGACDVVKCLLSFGADINLCDNQGQSPLFTASMEEQCYIVKCLLSSGADINLCDKEGKSPLIVASGEGECSIVKYLLSSGADINLCNKQGESPLFAASMKGHFYVLNNSFCNDNGESSFFKVSGEEHCDVVKCLLNSGADINLCNESEQSPLFAASMYGHCDVVKCLLNSGAGINLCDNQGISPLWVASRFAMYDIVKCLLSSGADVNLCDEDGTSPLVAASFSNDIVKLLTAHGALCEENVKAQYKTISKGTKDDEFLADSTTLLNLCGYPEEEISHQTEKQEEEKEAINVPKVQEEKKETILTREQEEKEEIIYTKETKEGNAETIEGRKEQTK
jgi:ankyrin repeat protein